MKRTWVAGAFIVLLLIVAVVVYVQTNKQQAESVPLDSSISADISENDKQSQGPVPIALYNSEGESRNVTAVPSSIAGSNALLIQFLSLNHDVSLEKEPWMDFKKFDSDLTQLENQQANHLTETKGTWTQIIASTDTRSQMISHIEDSIASVQEFKQNFLARRDTYQKDKVSETNSAKKDVLVQLESVSTDILLLSDLQVEIKGQTLKAAQLQNVDMAVEAANDEDRISLVIGWHTTRFDALIAQYLSL